MYHYVYILESKKCPSKHYIGYTTNIKERLKKHNEGGSPYSSIFKPWKFKTIIAFSEKEKATAFERYLKSHSGRAFTIKHL